MMCLCLLPVCPPPACNGHLQMDPKFLRNQVGPAGPAAQGVSRSGGPQPAGHREGGRWEGVGQQL